MPIFASIKLEGLAEEYPKGDWIEPHQHDAHQIVHASAGIMRVFGPGGVWVVPTGRAVWIPAGSEHSIRCISQVSMRTVYLRGQHTAFSSQCAVWNVSTLMRELIIRVAEKDCRGQQAHILALLLSEIEHIDTIPVSLPEPLDENLKRMTATLLEHPDDKRTLESWASSLGMSKRSLIRRFQKQTGFTFRQWRQQARLLSALEGLAMGRGVTAVALDVGYENPSAFIAVFHEAFGVTPGKYFTNNQVNS